jgi:predicted RNase H-like HicB family nuclease
MSTIVFIAFVSIKESGGYQASFPDFDTCSATGADLANLLVNARQVLTSRLEALEQSGEAWPSPTSIEQVSPPAGAMPIPIDVAVDDPPVRINISLGERLVQRLDAAAEARGMTRSGFIARSVRVSLGETARNTGDDDVVGRKLQDELAALGRRINDSIGPDSPFTRRMNELDGAVYEQMRKAADTVSAAMARRRDATKPGGRGNGDASASD